MWRRHRKARQPLEAICVIACSTIAVGSGIKASSTPIRISPPAMPNRPDRNAVATISRPRAAIISGVMRISADISALLASPAQTELSCPGISFPEGSNAAAAVSQRHQGVRGRGAQRKFCRRRRRTQRVGGGGQPDGASARAAARRRLVRAQGQPAGDDGRRARLSERADADLRRAGEPDRAGDRPHPASGC